ncbi:MAG: DMT family transporter [Nocardioidaceae bacterium]
MIPGFLIAVPAAVAAAAAFGGAGVLQHRATHQAPERPALSPFLLLDLVKLNAFRSGVILGALGFCLQVVALRYGPLGLVQPLLVTGVLFYLFFGAAYAHRHVDRGLVAGTMMSIAGLTAFLVVSRPVPGHGQFGSAAALPLGLGLVCVVVVCLLVASRVRKEMRSLPLAVATAVFYGVTAGLVRSIAEGGVGWQMTHRWELYALIVVGPTGFLLNQNAFQQGSVGSLALGTITVGDPLVAIGIGVAWFGELVATGPWHILGEVLALAVMVGGVFLLAARAQRLTERMEAERAVPPNVCGATP